jgi:hypothetical protein
LKGAPALGPILLGYGFVILGVLIAAYSTRRTGFLLGSAPLGNPFRAMFLTGLWAGLILGGLGSIFYVSPLAGVITVGILIAGKVLIPRRKIGR